MAAEIAAGVLIAAKVLIAVAVGVMGFVVWLIVFDDDQPGVG